MDNDQRVPISILSGFLGSGKTTCINNIIKNNKNDKIAIIVNEFGDIGIDADLIVSSKELTVELNNGCICCSSKGDLLRALYELFMRKVGALDPIIDFNKVIIETTGIADPTPLAQAIYTDMQLNLSYRIDAIITIVDTKNIIQQLSNTKEAHKQIALADKIIFNKIDLVDNKLYQKALKDIQYLNPFCLTQAATYGDISHNSILNLGLFDPKVNESALNQWIGSNSKEPGHNIQNTHTNINSVTFNTNKAIDYQKLIETISIFNYEYGNKLYRTKGIIWFNNNDKPVIVQGVQQVFSPMTYAEKWPEGYPSTKIVFIGEQLNEEYILTKLHRCIYNSDGIDRSRGAI